MRTVAQKTGVSRAAPYHHFKDKDALLAAVMTAGFHMLTQRIRDAIDPIEDPWQRIVHMGRAYVHFALNEPMLSRMMFGDSLLDKEEHPDVRDAGQESFSLLMQLVIECMALPDARTEVDPLTFAMGAWSTVHGLSLLLVEGKSEVIEHACPTATIVNEKIIDDVLEMLLYSIRRD